MPADTRNTDNSWAARLAHGVEVGGSRVAGARLHPRGVREQRLAKQQFGASGLSHMASARVAPSMKRGGSHALYRTRRGSLPGPLHGTSGCRDPGPPKRTALRTHWITGPTDIVNFDRRPGGNTMNQTAIGE